MSIQLTIAWLLLISLYSNFAYIPHPKFYKCAPNLNICKYNPHLNIFKYTSHRNIFKYKMISMGNLRNNIEQMSRLLDENKASMKGVLIRKKQIYSGKYSNGSTKEHKWLNEKFNNLTQKEENIRTELQNLIVMALEQQLKNLTK